MTCSSCATPNGFGIDIHIGESKTLQYTVKDSTSTLVDLTLARIYFSVKERTEDTVYVFQLKSVTAGGDGVVITIPDQTIPANRGTFQVYLGPAYTTNLEPKRYIYDVWVTPANNKNYDLFDPSPFNVRFAVTVLSA